jgi:large subunit ribosomal protein L11
MNKPGKKVKAVVKLDLIGGKATTSAPVGPTLGQHGVNLIAFCKEYNEKTKNNIGDVVPAKITIYEDRSFQFEIKSSPTSYLLKKYALIKQGSSNAKKIKIGTVTLDIIEKVAMLKLADLNTSCMKAASEIISGTAKNMGLLIQK